MRRNSQESVKKSFCKIHPINQSTSCHHTDHRLPPGPPPRLKKHPHQRKNSTFLVPDQRTQNRKALPQPQTPPEQRVLGPQPLWPNNWSLVPRKWQEYLPKASSHKNSELGRQREAGRAAPAGDRPRKCLSRPQPPPARLSIQVLTSLPPQRVPAAGGGPAPPALPPPGPRRGARGESGARRHGPDTLPRSARPPAAPEPGPGRARPSRAGRAEQPPSPAPAQVLRGRGGVPAWREATSNRAPPPGPARGETVTRVTWGPRQLTDSHLGFLRAAVAPLRPPPLLFLSPRRHRAAPCTNSRLVVGNWKCGSHSPPPPSPSVPSLALHSARLRSPPPPPPPPQRARVGSPRPPSSSSRRRRRGALPPGLARAPDAGERALGLEEPPPPGSRAPPLRPRLRDQVGPPPSARRLRPGPVRRGLSMVSPVLAPSRACERVTRPNPHRPFQAEIAAVIQLLQTSKILPRA